MAHIRSYSVSVLGGDERTVLALSPLRFGRVVAFALNHHFRGKRADLNTIPLLNEGKADLDSFLNHRKISANPCWWVRDAIMQNV
jgi:hypothetical protein